MLRGVRNLGRLLAVIRHLAAEDALFPLARLGVPPLLLRCIRRLWGRRAKGRDGVRLARALQRAGPSFIKLGQALSTRSDLLGQDVAEDLSELQDRLPPFAGSAARQAVADEFGRDVDSLFLSFEDSPVAAASIAQVHFAVTADGREVAVKVLRPGIEALFARDIELLRWLAELAEWFQPQLRRLHPVDAIRTVAETVRMEMDLRFEAAAAAELAGNFAAQPEFRIPAVDWTRTGRRVLTTERVAGVPLNDRAGVLGAGHDPEAVLEIAARSFFFQVFRDGFFHADLHPGNLFVCEDGALAAVDFGIMGRLDKKTRRHLAELLAAFLTGNYRRAAEVHFAAGWVPPGRSVEAFAQACRSIGEPIFDRPQNEISIARLLGQLFEIAETFHMETQPQLLLLQKTMLVAEGSGRILVPEANMWLLARPLMEDWMAENLGPEARLRDTVESLREALIRLPGVIENLDKGSEMLQPGGLRLHPDTIAAMRGDGTRRSSQLWMAAAIVIIVILLAA